MAHAALAEAARLGQMAHDETGFGKAEDKREKNRFAAEDVWNYFKTLKTVGVVSDNGNIVEIASPRGVVAAIIPSTNPTSTAIFCIVWAICPRPKHRPGFLPQDRRKKRRDDKATRQS